ncbi:hypothetical protein NC661_17930 [Aquibacillus koreensis]|uniref:Uncharacterized protein n=1 Tax=Aquibacillus koreensis TaxID=279446 RepID=A0A9X3WLE3_9BACI|nr:DUF6880 family protein [Aquibacillus koreensis]MCT2535397.1 hypothetical protein [Aquibacillus koreensis]MDC3422232.1 hypothetical protein [Aquibacillus koreensis]
MDLYKKIEKLTKQELVDLIMNIVDGDENVEKKVEYKLISPNDEIKASKQLIRKYINENKRRGFISWRNVHAALEGAEMVLEKGRNKLITGEEEVTVRLSIATLSIVIDMLQYADDSGGEIGYMVNQCITLLEDASSLVLVSSDYRVQDTMFQLLVKEAMHKRYDGWSDTRYQLLDVCTIYSVRAAARKKLEATLDKLLSDIDAISSWSSDYDQEAIHKLQLKILERNGEFDRVEQFINDNLEYDEFRKMAIEKELENENFGAALQLCEEGEKNDEKYPGLVKQWKQYRLQVYEGLGDIEKQKELLFEFVYANDYEPYNKLKELFRQDEWNTVVEDIFATFENADTGYLPNVYVYIAKQENRTDKILQYCQYSPISILEYYRFLLDDHLKEAQVLFLDYVRGEAEEATDRKKYRNVCKKLETYKLAFGEAKFQDFVMELRDTYERKPAFLNELEKIERKVLKI